MEYAAFVSASIAAVRTILGDQSYDVAWEHSWDAGIRRKDKHVNILVIDDVVQVEHMRLTASGSGYIQEQWVNHNLTVQYTVLSDEQTLSSSSYAIANKIRSAYALDEIQDIYKAADVAPHTPGPIFQIDEVKDDQRWYSESTFEQSFNVVTVTSLPNVAVKGFVQGVEVSGSVTGSDGTIYNADFWVTSAYSGAIAPIEDFTGIMDEALIHFNWESEKTQNFTFVFDDVPDSVVLSVYDDPENSGGVFLQGVSYTSESLSIEASAPFTGSVRYRAIWSNHGYPVTVTSSLEPLSGTLSGSANKLHASGLTGNPQTTWFTYWTELEQSANEFHITYWSNNKGTPIPVLNVDGFDNEEASGSIAAPILNEDGSGGFFNHVAFVTSSA